MPAHRFVEFAGQEVSFCGDCGGGPPYIWEAPVTPWRGHAIDQNTVSALDEGDLLLALAKEQPSEQDARMIVSVWLVKHERLQPSKDPTKFEERIQAILGAARRVGWGLVDKTKENTMPLDERREALAKRYSHLHKVSLDRGRQAVLNNYTAPPAPVDPESATLEARARVYAKDHAVGMDEAIRHVAMADPGLLKRYVAVPVFPVETASSEPTQDQLLAALTLTDLLELCVERKLGDDKIARILVYDWVTDITGQEVYGSQSAADWCDAFWTKVKRERFRREGIGGQNVTAPGR